MGGLENKERSDAGSSPLLGRENKERKRRCFLAVQKPLLRENKPEGFGSSPRAKTFMRRKGLNIYISSLLDE